MTKEEAKDILSSKKVIGTPKRVALLRVLSTHKKPVSVSELLKKVQKDIELDLVTMYRNLTLLSNVGIVKELHLQKGVSLYEYNKGDHHHHFICRGCGYIEDIHDCLSLDITEKALKNTKKFSSVSDHSFELFGICNVCSK
jgi:Fe2+ or Zn2+ uptake regulation protein